MRDLLIKYPADLLRLLLKFPKDYQMQIHLLLIEKLQLQNVENLYWQEEN